MPEPKLTLHRKLAQVMYEAERIPKNGRAPKEMGGYKFVQVGDAADYIRKALAEKVITMLPTAVHVVGQQDRPTKSGGSMTTVDLLTEWTLTDGESGESVTIMSFGAGADGGDKYSGKASTSAMKYALLTGFLLSTGDDTEAAVTPEQTTRRFPGLVDGDPQPAHGRAVDEYEIDARGARPELERRADGLIGVATKGADPADLGLRYDPDGTGYWGFKLKAGKTGYQAFATGQLAETLNTANLVDSIEGQNVTVWGKVEMVPWRKGDREMPPYARIIIEKMQTPEWTLPAPVDPLTVPMFDEPTDEEKAAIIAAEEAEARGTGR